MKQNTQENNILRQYLLGTLSSEAEKDAVEKDFIADDEYFQKLEIQEESLIQEYVYGSLSTEERRFFEQNFLISEERRKELMLVQSLQRYAHEKVTEKPEAEPILWSFRKLFSSPFVTAAAFAVLVIIAFIAGKVIFQSANVKDASVDLALNKAYQNERPFDSRISGFDYAPTNNSRGAEKKDSDTLSLDRARILSDDSFEKVKTAASLHSLGKVYLAGKDFDKAIGQLENAKELAPQDVGILNDLGSAYLEKGKTLSISGDGRSNELLAKSLGEFEKAIAIDPNLQSARFNKAICLQALKQPHQAQEAWQEYLKLDDQSPWANEARQKLKIIQSESSQ